MSEPTCAFHGLKWSEHQSGRCLYCALCFVALTVDTCYIEADGSRVDLCDECGSRAEG